MKSASGTFELDTPRNRNGSFEPELVKKNQTHMSDELESKILSLPALGNSYAQDSVAYPWIEDYMLDYGSIYFTLEAGKTEYDLGSFEIKPH